MRKEPEREMLSEKTRDRQTEGWGGGVGARPKNNCFVVVVVVCLLLFFFTKIVVYSHLPVNQFLLIIRETDRGTQRNLTQNHISKQTKEQAARK